MKIIPAALTLTLSACVTVTETVDNTPQSSDIEMAESRISLGLGYMGQGNMVKARENLEKALAHAPSYYRSQLSIAHYYEKVGEPDMARQYYRSALKQHPRNGNVLNNYGTFLCKQGEYEQADRYFNQAIDQPYYYLVSASYENAALCALKSGNKEQAYTYFQRTLDHDPNRARSILQIANLEIEKGKYIDARIRLMKFHQRYGLKKPSLQLLIKLEDQAGNEALKEKYQKQLDSIA